MLIYGTAIDGLQMGLCFAVLALGVYISYSILDFSDLSTDGTFPLGGVICTILMLRLGVPSVPAVFLSFFAGMAAGAVTGFLHVKFGISKLLSGIIVMTGLMSVTLALTCLLSDQGYPTTIFSYRSKELEGLFGGKLTEVFGPDGKDYAILLILFIIVLVLKLLIDLFFRTKLGYMLKATGDNEQLVTSLGKNAGVYKILGVSIANGFCAVSGALYSQLFMQYDNTSGSGKVVTALASVIIGLALFSGVRRMKGTTSVIIGAIIYSLCLNFLALLDKNGIYLKLMNAVMFALILIFHGKIKSLISGRRRGRSGSSADAEE